MNKPASRWLAAKESRVGGAAVEGEVGWGGEVALSGVIVESVDRLVVGVLLSGVRRIMGGIAVTVGLSVVNLSEVSVRIVLALYE